MKCGTKIKIQLPSLSTSNMRSHLQDMHGLTLPSSRPKAVTMAVRATLPLTDFFSPVPTPASDSSSSSSPQRPARQKKRQYLLMLLRLSIEMNTSFRSIAESAVLGEFMWEELGFKLPSRTAFTRLLPRYYGSLMASLKRRLASAESISVTTDSTFLTLHQKPYIAVTGHWIEADWVLRRAVLAVFEADQQETGEWIARRLRVVLEDQLCLSSKLHCVVTDEG